MGKNFVIKTMAVVVLVLISSTCLAEGFEGFDDISDRGVISGRLTDIGDVINTDLFFGEDQEEKGEYSLIFYLKINLFLKDTWIKKNTPCVIFGEKDVLQRFKNFHKKNIDEYLLFTTKGTTVDEGSTTYHQIEIPDIYKK